jgi:putative phosphoesterase
MTPPPRQPCRIALIADVHANLAALDAVLDHAAAAGATSVWNAGDAVGYGPWPEDTVRRLREVADLAVVGNYDLKVLQAERRIAVWRRTKQPLKAEAFLWAYRQLSPASRAYLGALPREVRRSVGGVRVLLTHASPASIKEKVGAETSDRRWRELEAAAARSGRVDLVLAGHDHRGYTRRGGLRFVNPGSVGRPEDGDPRANYAVVALADGEATISHHRVAYDVERTAAAIRAHGLPEPFAQVVLQGRTLNDVLGEC